jgi:pimeloyl-ACP methyl ester carboxylesterase
MPLTEAEAIRTAAPHARVEVVEGTGHLTPAERPERFAAILGDFLREVVG